MVYTVFTGCYSKNTNTIHYKKACAENDKTIIGLALLYYSELYFSVFDRKGRE